MGDPAGPEEIGAGCPGHLEAAPLGSGANGLSKVSRDDPAGGLGPNSLWLEVTGMDSAQDL